MADQEKKQPDKDSLNIEYQECVSASRFVVGTRFNYFLSFTTFFFILVGAFHYVWASDQNVFGTLKPTVMLTIALFGLFMVAIALTLEQRAAQLYKDADKRATELERLMGIQGGIRQIFIFTLPAQRKKFFFIPVTHTASIRMFYRVVNFIWILLMLFSGYHVLYQVLDSLKLLKGDVP